MGKSGPRCVGVVHSAEFGERGGVRHQGEWSKGCQKSSHLSSSPIISNPHIKKIIGTRLCFWSLTVSLQELRKLLSPARPPNGPSHFRAVHKVDRSEHCPEVQRHRFSCVFDQASTVFNTSRWDNDATLQESHVLVPSSTIYCNNEVEPT